MPHLGKTSVERLDTACTELQLICRDAIKVYDFSVICGFHNENEQNMHYLAKTSKTRWPNSKHNVNPSEAVDLGVYHPEWGLVMGGAEEVAKISKATGLTKGSVETIIRCSYYMLAGVMKASAVNLGYELRWGGDWDSDNDFFDNKFNDLMHFEMVRKGSKLWRR